MTPEQIIQMVRALESLRRGGHIERAMFYEQNGILDMADAASELADAYEAVKAENERLRNAIEHHRDASGDCRTCENCNAAIAEGDMHTTDDDVDLCGQCFHDIFRE